MSDHASVCSCGGSGYLDCFCSGACGERGEIECRGCEDCTGCAWRDGYRAALACWPSRCDALDANPYPAPPESGQTLTHAMHVMFNLGVECGMVGCEMLITALDRGYVSLALDDPREGLR